MEPVTVVHQWTLDPGTNYGLTVYASADFGEMLTSFLLLVLIALVLLRIVQSALR